MKVFISYHRKDTKYKSHITELLKKYNISFYSVDERLDLDGMNHQAISEKILPNMDTCDVLLCIVGVETFSRPHVDWEIHYALKGAIEERKGILVVLLETRNDSKRNIDMNTFPTKLAQNMEYIVIEQYSTIAKRLPDALIRANQNRDNKKLKTNHSNPIMQLRSGNYHDQH